MGRVTTHLEYKFFVFFLSKLTTSNQLIFKKTKIAIIF